MKCDVLLYVYEVNIILKKLIMLKKNNFIFDWKYC